MNMRNKSMPWVWERKKLNNRLQSRFFYFYSSNHRLLSKRFTLKLFNRNVMFVLNIVFQERCSWKRRKKMFMFLFFNWIQFTTHVITGPSKKWLSLKPSFEVTHPIPFHKGPTLISTISLYFILFVENPTYW